MSLSGDIAAAAVGSKASEREASPTKGLLEVLSCAGVAGVIFLVLGILSLERGHPEEDAYILFRYSDHVAQGKGIVFNSMGPRAEGATDFLWMIMLSALDWLGMDVAVATVVLNALGAGLAAFVLAKVIVGAGLQPGLRRVWLVMATVMVPFLSAAMAAYGCFSSMLYAGFIVFAVHTALVGSARALLWLPAMALALGLFRPDGVIIATGTVVLGLIRARSLGILPRLLVGLAVAGVCGGVYYVWRYSYFGLPLPLPLYVKSRIGDIDKLAQMPEAVRSLARAMPGLGANLHWLVIGGVLGSGLVCLVTGWLLYRSERSLPKLAMRALGALPFAMLLGSLTFAYQTQNFQWRFQGPIQLGVLYFAVRGLAAVTRRGLLNPLVGTGMLLVSVAMAMHSGVTSIGYHLDPMRGGYLNVFAARFGATLKPETRVALTEAGRFPFWSPAQVLDTIGLNSPEAAVRPVTSKMLAEFNPDVLLFHTTSAINVNSLYKGETMVRIDGFSKYVEEPYKEAFQKDYSHYDEFPFSSVKLPSLVMARYVEQNLDKYEIAVVDAGYDSNEYTNILAVRKELAEKAFAELKAAGRPEAQASYFALAAQYR